jgi:hypothetical protein
MILDGSVLNPVMDSTTGTWMENLKIRRHFLITPKSFSSLFAFGGSRN